MNMLFNDLRYTLRGLLKRPGFTVIAVLTLALGIGANTAIFSVVNAVLLKPLAAKDPDRLMTFWHSAPAKGLKHVDLNDALVAYYRDRTRTFQGLAAFETGKFSITGAGEPEVVPGAIVTFNYFEVLGREPLYGRTFTPQEDTPGNNHVALLSYALWQRRYGGNPNIVGRSINLDGALATIVGIMPSDFDFPNPAERANSSGHMQLWVPKGLDPQDATSWNLLAVGRLQPGATREEAEKEINALYVAWTAENGRQLGDGAIGSTTSTVMLPLQQNIVGEVRRPLLVLLGAIALVLLIACANLTNLLLARASARRREIAVRQCLGASATTIARQTLTESLLLSFCGSVAGVLLAVWIVTALKSFVSSQIPHIESARVDGTVLLFTVAIMLLTGVLCGLAPALRASRINLQGAIKEGARGSASGSNKRLNNIFVVSQLALSLVLLIGAALFLQSFRNLLSVNPGFRAENVLMARLSLPETKYKERPEVESFYNQVRAGVSSLPGVQAVELCQVVPFSGGGGGGPFTVEGFEGQPAKVAWLRSTTPGYFGAMGMPVLKGRAFASSDTEKSQPVAIVDERLARMYAPDGDLVDKRIRIGDGPWLTIVGVVPNVKNRKLDEEAWPYLYRPYSQWVRRETMLVVRGAINPQSLVGQIRQEVAKLDPELPLSDVSSIQQAMDRSLVTARLTNSLLVGFAVTALLLALTGIYGVMSLNVANRRNEFGIRLALGAQTSNVLKLILGQGLKLAAVGVALGLLAAIAFTRLLKGLLFGISASDPLTFGLIAALLVGVALLACWIPARRATRVDPLKALRNE
ncbi:MAG TPA: ABC transporter permease [Pyrinomonadaceae bacterium]|nr:ABC transporter permease [Pyrinomonadaceae bacterium]